MGSGGVGEWESARVRTLYTCTSFQKKAMPTVVEPKSPPVEPKPTSVEPKSPPLPEKGKVTSATPKEKEKDKEKEKEKKKEKEKDKEEEKEKKEKEKEEEEGEEEEETHVKTRKSHKTPFKSMYLSPAVNAMGC